MILSLFHRSSGSDSVCHRYCVYFARQLLQPFTKLSRLCLVKKNKGTVLILKIAIAAACVCVCMYVCVCVCVCVCLCVCVCVSVSVSVSVSVCVHVGGWVGVWVCAYSAEL